MIKQIQTNHNLEAQMDFNTEILKAVAEQLAAMIIKELKGAENMLIRQVETRLRKYLQELGRMTMGMFRLLVPRRTRTCQSAEQTPSQETGDRPSGFASEGDTLLLRYDGGRPV